MTSRRIKILYLAAFLGLALFNGALSQYFFANRPLNPISVGCLLPSLLIVFAWYRYDALVEQPPFGPDIAG